MMNIIKKWSSIKTWMCQTIFAVGLWVVFSHAYITAGGIAKTYYDVNLPLVMMYTYE